jgi:hypothetical protein
MNSQLPQTDGQWIASVWWRGIAAAWRETTRVHGRPSPIKTHLCECKVGIKSSIKLIPLLTPLPSLNQPDPKQRLPYPANIPRRSLLYLQNELSSQR